MYREVNDMMTQYIGLSTDQKPGMVDHGSSFFEMDTGKTFHYDGTSRTWMNSFDWDSIHGALISLNADVTALKSHLEAIGFTVVDGAINITYEEG